MDERSRRRGKWMWAAILLVCAAAAVWWGAQFFALNHVVFLLNQGEYRKALRELQNFKGDAEATERTAALETQALTLTGDFARAIDVGRQALAAEHLPAAGNYWLSLAEYQAGQTTGSRDNAARFLQTGARLPNGAITVARALAGTERITDVPELEGVPFRMQFPLEQGITLDFAAQQQMAVGNYNMAAQLSRAGLLRGNRNEGFLRRGTVVCVLSGDFDGARVFVEKGKRIVLEGAVADLLARRNLGKRGQAGDIKTRLSVYGETSAREGGPLDISRAVAWALARQVNVSGEMDQATSETLNAVLAEFPLDAVVQLCLADALRGAGDKVASDRLYEDLQKTDPSVGVWLKLNAENETGSSAVRLPSELLSQMSLVAMAGTFDQRDGHDAGVGLSSRPVELKAVETGNRGWPVRLEVHPGFSISEEGSYRMGVVLRGVGRPVYLRVGENGDWRAFFGEKGKWLLCCIPAQLTAGSYVVQLSGVSPWGRDGATESAAGTEVAGMVVEAAK